MNADHTDYYNGTPANGGTNGESAAPAQPALSLGNTTILNFNPPPLPPSFRIESAVFEKSAPEGSMTNGIVAHVTAHETGHVVDRLYRNFGDGATYFSQSTAFTDALARDVAAMELQPVCTFEAIDQNGFYASSGLQTPFSAGGITYQTLTFTRDEDGFNICDDRTSHYSGDMVAVIKQAYSYALDGNNDFDPVELFAEQFGHSAGFPDTLDNTNTEVGGNGYLFSESGAFKCTQMYVNTLRLYGRLPTAQELHNEAYVVPDGSGPPYGPMYRLYRCDGDTATHEDFSFGY